MQKTMNQIDAVVCDKLYSACFRFGLRPRITRPRPELRPQVKICLGYWSLEFGHCL